MSSRARWSERDEAGQPGPRNRPDELPVGAIDGNEDGYELLFASLEGIPSEYADVIRYHFLQGFSYEKIADLLDVSLSTVKWRCFRGKELLRSTLTAEPACPTECRTGCAQFPTLAPAVAVEEKRSLLEAAAARLKALGQNFLPGWQALVERMDVRATNWMACHSVQLLRISLGVIFFWFGVLKFFPGLSPAQDLASKTMSALTFGFVQPNVSIPVLATWECAIGLGLIFGVFLRATLVLLFLQMVGTFSPLILFHQEAFTHFPNAPTLEGQYIIKNMVLISAGLVIGATVRGGAIEADPEIIQLGHQAKGNVRGLLAAHSAK